MPSGGRREKEWKEAEVGGGAIPDPVTGRIKKESRVRAGKRECVFFRLFHATGIGKELRGLYRRARETKKTQIPSKERRKNTAMGRGGS